MEENELDSTCGLSDSELDYLKELVSSETHLILEFSQTGGFDNASGF